MGSEMPLPPVKEKYEFQQKKIKLYQIATYMGMFNDYVDQKRWAGAPKISCLSGLRLLKGQIISKANCQAVNSSKNQTNEFIFTTMRRVFVRFLEEIEDSNEIT